MRKTKEQKDIEEINAMFKKDIEEINTMFKKDKQTILQEAQGLIYGDRQKSYGNSRDRFTKIAKGWEQIFSCQISPEQVALAMVWLKVCRELNKTSRDNIVDIAGYAGCIEKIKTGA